ncbi:MAG TPA: tripartite tricarboxylate transporter substrate binding protein [Pararobbsia sp.]|jgi:tripartite-type tricarboxylate transporter receptor subunit TctC|nr:tripartite tricarboxylate transporter substrate binding protein [Burkholderiales bacterium]HTJ95532.1 tripartite tricarboxylate transporter substrate binding protein [Pararobbsia sp.]
MKVNKTAVACLIAAAAFVCGAAHAQNYPNKLVRFIVTYPPGGSSDVMARIIGQKLTEYWGQTVLIESRPGADGSIGMEYAAKQPADGYVMVLGNFGPVVAKPLLSKVSYDWQKDFAPVTRITISANILVVPKTLPVQRVKDLAALAKRYPGKLTYATSGPGSMSHFAGEMFKRLAGVDMITVPYKGNALAITDVMGGQITTMFSDAVPAVQAMKTGKLRALAVTSEQRWPFTPELPTLAEEGIKGFAAVNWWGILFPAGVPRAIIDKVNADVVRALATPDVKTRLGEVGVEAITSTPEQFGQFMASEAARWGKLVKEANLRVD